MDSDVYPLNFQGSPQDVSRKTSLCRIYRQGKCANFGFMDFGFFVNESKSRLIASLIPSPRELSVLNDTVTVQPFIVE
jgi:hypothetical protein